jgi:polar amino acid transport system substrate-binding protein
MRRYLSFHNEDVMKLLRLALPLLALCVLLAAPLAEAGKLEQIKARGELTVGVKDAEAPFGFIEEKTNQLEGFDIDVAHYVAQRLDVKLKFKPLAAADRLPALIQGAVDMVAASLEHTLQREDVIDFSLTYFIDGLQLLTHKDSTINGLADLAGKKVAVVKGSGLDKLLKSKQPHLIPLFYEGLPQAFMAVKRGEAAAVCSSTVSLLGLKHSDDKPDAWSISGEFIEPIHYGLGLPENDSDFRDAVNKALADMWKTGEYEKTYNKWFGVGARYPLPLNWKMELWSN